MRMDFHGKLKNLTNFCEFEPYEQIAWYQQLREPPPIRGRPRKLYAELLADRRQLYLSLFLELLSNNERAKVLFHGPREAIAEMLKRHGYQALISHDEAALWIHEAMHEATAKFARRRTQAKFMTDYLIAKQARTSVRYLRRVFNQAKRCRPRPEIL